jgi:hypothetical protein
VAVNENPYESWQELKADSDYRSTDTQINSLVRQQLSQSEYLRNSNRVNPGPRRNYRAGVADSKAQIPHPVGSEDMWGWQQWTQVNPSSLTEPPEAEDLLEVVRDGDIQGKTYDPLGEVGGASS